MRIAERVGWWMMGIPTGIRKPNKYMLRYGPYRWGSELVAWGWDREKPSMRIRKRKTIGTRLHKVYFLLWDGLDELVLGKHWYRHSKIGGWKDRTADFIEGYIAQPTLWLLCKIYGHEPIGDQCNLPEHDYCSWCRRPMPGMAPHRKTDG